MAHCMQREEEKCKGKMIIPVKPRQSIYTSQTPGIYEWLSKNIESKSKKTNTVENEECRDEEENMKRGGKVKGKVCIGQVETGTKSEKRGEMSPKISIA